MGLIQIAASILTSLLVGALTPTLTRYRRGAWRTYLLLAAERAGCLLVSARHPITFLRLLASISYTGSCHFNLVHHISKQAHGNLAKT